MSQLLRSRRLQFGLLRAGINLALSVGLAVTGGIARAHEYYTENFTLIHPWTGATAAGVTRAGVYFKLSGVRQADRIIGASSPIAERVELRASRDPEATAAPSLPVPAAELVEFEPSGPHLVMVGLKMRIEEGRSYPLTLVFERGGSMSVSVSVGDQ